MTSILQGSFTGGELSPSLWGRTDLARYANSLKTCRNFIISPYGGAKNRPGTVFVGEVEDSTKTTRLIPFVFSPTQSYVLELGHNVMRIIKNGAYVKSGSTIVEVVTPWTSSQVFALNYAQSADVLTVVHPDVKPYDISRFSDTSWTVTATDFQNGPFDDVNTNRASVVYVSGDVGSVTLYSTADIFTANHVGSLFYIQQNSYNQHWRSDVSGISIGSKRTNSGVTYQAVSGTGNSGTATPTHKSGIDSDGNWNWMYMHDQWGVLEITAVTSGYQATATVKRRIPGECVIDHTSKLTISSASDSSGSLLVNTSSAHGFSGGENISILYTNTSGETQVFNTTVASVTDTDTFVCSMTYSFSAFASGYVWDSNSYQMPTHLWAFGAWNNVDGWPSVVGYHQQRRVFAATDVKPQTLWMSRSGAFTDFGTNVDIQDDDAVTFTIASGQVNTINGLASLSQLVILTNGGVWVLGTGDADVITPTNIALKKQSYNGSHGILPLGIANSSLYVQRGGNAVRDLAYEFASDSYSGQDLAVPASHLLAGYEIVDWAYQNNPYYCVWMVRNDGALLGLTYMREQQVSGWHRHDTDGVIESVACISEGAEDYLYMVVKRTISGSSKRYVERMATRAIDDIRDLVLLDSSLTYDGRNTTATTITVTGGTNWDHTEDLTVTASSAIFAHPATTDVGDSLVIEDDGVFYRLTILSTSSTTVATCQLKRTLPVAYRGVATEDWYFARDTLSGLSHLEGKTVSVQADGGVAVQKVVSSGAITLDPPAFIAHVGLPVESDFATLDVNTSNGETLLDKKKAIHAVRMLVDETNGLKIGRDYDHLAEVKFRSGEFYDASTDLYSGLVTARIPTSWSTGGGFVVRVSDPYPVTILAVIPEVNFGGV